MAKIKYIEYRFSGDSLIKLEEINSILSEYAEQGFRMTLRQLYYQMVSRNIIKNSGKEYTKLSRILSKGREAGVVDWGAIEDRGRRPHLPYSVGGIKDALLDTAVQYRLNRMEGQRHYIEIWCEKDALSNVFIPICEKYHIRFLANKGFGSSSSMHEASLRFARGGARPVLIYVGDHDPSGQSMVRDIKNRMCGTFDIMRLKVINPALTFEQVQLHNLPENVARKNNPENSKEDPNLERYEAEFGPYCWELDALSPTILTEIIETALVPFIDLDLYNAMLEQESKERVKLEEIADEY